MKYLIYILFFLKYGVMLILTTLNIEIQITFFIRKIIPQVFGKKLKELEDSMNVSHNLEV
ncbi:MAG: hypothetical protein ACI9FW_001364 [Flavobacterium sp.]|jgi:hypothetical protein